MIRHHSDASTPESNDDRSWYPLLWRLVLCGVWVGKSMARNRAHRPAMSPVGGVQECVQEWRRKGCESRFRPSHPVRLTPQLFTYLAKLAFSAACSRAHAWGLVWRTPCPQVVICQAS